MSRTPKITRAARRIHNDEALALTTGKTIAKALDARGLLPADAADDCSNSLLRNSGRCPQSRSGCSSGA